MPLINKQPFIPNPIPDNSDPDDGVFYHELTNEIFTSHDAFFDRFLYCNSLIWTCSRTGKSGLTYKEALDSEQQESVKKAKRKRLKQGSGDTASKGASTGGGDGAEPPVKKKKKKYPYDPKKYSMPVPEGFDPSLLTPTGKIDGRKLKSKKNKEIADVLLANTPQTTKKSSTTEPQLSKKSKLSKKKNDEALRKEEEARKKEEEAKRKAELQAELAKERELEAKRKKEAAALARQLERQKKEEERKKAAAFLQNWEKKCEDLERDDLRRLPQPVPINCDIPEKLFGDAIFISESLYNLHDLYNFSEILPEGLSYDTLEEMLISRQEEGPLATIIQYLIRLVFNLQPTGEGYGLDDDQTNKNSTTESAVTIKQEEAKINNNNIKQENADAETNHHDYDTNGLGEHETEHDEDDENEDKEVNMNDLIGSAIKAAQEVKKSLSKPLPEMEINSTNVTEVLRLHFLQSGSFPKGRTIYNGWYSSREDPGLWLCMREPDLMKKLEKTTIYDLDMEERIKILHTLIYQIFSFIKTRGYIESASEVLTELRKTYRSEAAAFARWDRENCVKRMQPPKRKSEQNSNQTTNSDKSNGNDSNNLEKSTDQLRVQSSNPSSVSGDVNDIECDFGGSNNNNDKNNSNNNQLKSCLKTNGTGTTTTAVENMNTDLDDMTHSKKKITFQASINGGAIGDNNIGDDDLLTSERVHGDEKNNHQINGLDHEEQQSDQDFEELERAYQQNLVDYEDYQRERAIRHEQLNATLLDIRDKLRSNQGVYGVHPIGRDRAYRRYWVFQSLPGLFVEQDDEYVGKCLPNPTPLESRYKKLFGKENPLMHANEADLLRTKTCDVGCSTDPIDTDQPPPQSSETNEEGGEEGGNHQQLPVEQNNNHNQSDELDNEERLLNGELVDGDHNQQQQGGVINCETGLIIDEMNYCTGSESSCYIHGQKRSAQPKWWFYHTSESLESLIESLNKRGFRESELQDVLIAEMMLLKPKLAECPAFKLNKDILEQSGIRRSRRLKTKGSKRRGRNYDRD